MTTVTFIILVFYCVKTVASAACYSTVVSTFYTSSVSCEEEKKHQQVSIDNWANRNSLELYGVTIACVPMEIISLSGES